MRRNKYFLKKKIMKKMEINGIEVGAGEEKMIKVNVARLPSGTVISLRVHVFRSTKPGPTMLVMGGVHGDEINGVEIVRESIARKFYTNLEAGTVIAIPLLNIYGFINFSRDASDGKDVNRSFPGSMMGSLASRVAGTLTKKILPFVDFAVDFHTGGSARYNYPQIRYTIGDERAEELAFAFGAPYLIRKANISKTLRKVAHGMKIPVLVFEGGESLRLDGFSIERGLKGLRRLMQSEKMIAGEPEAMAKPFVFNKTTWVRASRSGLFRWSQQSGAKVSVGEPLGKIQDPYGEFSVKVLSNKEGYIIGHNNAPVVSQGDALFHIGYDRMIP